MSDHCISLESMARSSSSTVIKRSFCALRRFLSLAALLCVSVPLLPAQAPTPVPVYTWRYDNTHAGQNTQETALTPTNVNGTNFGKLFTLKTDTTMYAQPLYVPAIKMVDGLVHNVVFAETENDTVYAFDADSNGGANAKPIWQITLTDAAHGAGAGATSVPYKEADQGDIGPTIGITGTPVIDPATNTMYLVGKTKEKGVYHTRLHALNIINGAEKLAPVEMTASVTGTGTGSTGGKVSFNPLTQNQRPALNLLNGTVYIAFASHGDNGVWHGWIFAYEGATLTQTAAVCLTPNGTGAGIWSSGAGLPIDEDVAGGRMFVATGNGTFSKAYPPLNNTTSLGESIVAYSLANGGLTPTDVFTTFNAQPDNAEDVDLGSGGILMVPDQTGTHPHILLQAGKEGRLEVLDRDNLGGFTAGSNTNALQEITKQFPGLWSTPAYWNGKVYLWGGGCQENCSPSDPPGVPMAFSLENGVLSTTPLTKSNIVSGFPGPSFSISSNGTNDGIAWAVRSDQFATYGQQVLYAFNANDLATPLYESDTNAKRDAAGVANKFSIPVVTNGKVYVVALGSIGVYGLLNGETSTAAPVITPDGGTFAASQTVSITSTTPGAEIFYTLDGTTPTPASTAYAGPITINTDTTVNAIASAANFLQSSVTSAVFNFSNQTPLLSFAPAAGTYTTTQNVTISNSDANAKIHYTVDGSTPTAASPLYTGPVKVAVSETINAIAIDPALTNSDIGTAAYVISAAGSTINFANGFSTTAGLKLNGNALASNDIRLQLTDGGLNEASSVFWTTPINVQAFTTTFQFQISTEADPPGANGMTFTIQNNAATALGGPSSGLGYGGILNSVAVKFNFYDFNGEGSDSTGFYTNGEAPVLPTIDISPSGIQLNSGDTITATLTYDGTTLKLHLLDELNQKTFDTFQAIDIAKTIGSNTAYVGFTGGSGGLSSSQKIIYWTYSTQSVPATYVPPAGTYANAQTVSLSSATADAAIYYTTDGTTPNAGSTQFAGPIPIFNSQTLQSIAISPTLGASNVNNAAYVITNPTPAFTMSGAPSTTVAQGATATAAITITPVNGFTGSVAFTCTVAGPAGAAAPVDPPTCPAQAATVTGTAAFPASLTIDTTSKTTVETYSVTVTGTAAGGVTQTAIVPLQVTAPPANPSFALKAPAITIATPGTPGTSTVTITPSGGFTGTVALACAVTGPAGVATVVDPPTCSATQPAAIADGSAVTSTLTVTTTAATTSALHYPLERIFTIGGGGTLVALLFLGLPRRRRKGQALFSLLVLLAVATALTACGGSGGGTPTNDAGTTPGTYTVTVTGTSGTMAPVTVPVTLTVQ